MMFIITPFLCHVLLFLTQLCCVLSHSRFYIFSHTKDIRNISWCSEWKRFYLACYIHNILYASYLPFKAKHNLTLHLSNLGPSNCCWFGLRLMYIKNSLLSIFGNIVRIKLILRYDGLKLSNTMQIHQH